MVAKLHPENKGQLKQALNRLRQNPFIGKDLQQELFEFKSLRLKKYRVIYTVSEEANPIEIYYIGCRSDVFEEFRRLLTQLQIPDN